MWKKNIFLHKIAYKIALCFLCVSMVLTFNVRRSKAFAITGGTMVACWAVGAIIAFATGYQLSTNDLAREKVVELCEMEKGFYDQLLSQMGTDLTKGLFTSHAIVESVISGAVSSFSDKVSISLSWINDHLAQLKPIANDWLNQIKTKFFASDNDIVNVPDNIRDFLTYDDKRIIIYGASKEYFESLLFDSFKKQYTDEEYIKRQVKDAVSSFESSQYFNYIDFLRHDVNFNMFSNILKLIYDKYGYEALKKSGNYFKLVSVSNGEKYISLYINDLYIDLKKEFSYESSDLIICSPGYNQDNFGSATHLSIPDVNFKLEDKIYSPTLDNKHKTLDNVKNYTDNLNDNTLDGVGYVSPNSLQLDKTNHDTYVVSNPGELDFPYSLPNDLTVDPTKPYEGTDGKTVDKPWDPTLPWALPSDLPVSIPLPNDAVLPIDLPYDDVIDATKDDPTDPTLDPDYTTPKVNDDEYSDTYRDWHKIFPFCIPWDYAKIVNFFRADKKAPSFEFDLGNVVTSGNKSKTLKVDLSEYEEQGKWLRNLELILFAVGLLLITRYIIKG